MPPRKKTATLLPEPAPDADLQAIQAEVAAEPDGLADGYTPVPFLGKTVRVKDFLDWPATTGDMFVVGRYTQGVANILHPDDFLHIWGPANPTNRQAIEFMAAVQVATGIPLGLSVTLPTS